MEPIVDTHCHLAPYGEDTTETPTESPDAYCDRLWSEARESGVEILIDVGIDAASSERALERAHRLNGVVATAGLHPCSAEHRDRDLARIRELCDDDAIVAVGETGYDLYWHPDRIELQREAFRDHLALGAETDRAVIIHSRDAFDPTFETLSENHGARIVWHCFTGGPKEAERAAALGAWISFAGPLTYKRSDALREAAALVPEDRLLVETDAPFLPPHPHRGRPNRPALILETLGRLAEIRDWSLEEAARRTTRNAQKAFGGRLPLSAATPG